MKNLIIFSILFSLQAFSADLNLSSGETTTIQANTKVTVTCGGGSSGSSCSEAVASFKYIVSSCMKTYDTVFCLNKHFPIFKSENPKCVYNAIPACLEICEKTYDNGFCMLKCN